MKRQTTHLQLAAAKVEADLRRTIAMPWLCTIGTDFVLTISDGVTVESVLLESEVEDYEWFVSDRASLAEIEEGLIADADEVVASEAVEVLRVMNQRWPLCPDHAEQLEPCSGVWTCEGPPNHDVLVGELGR